MVDGVQGVNHNAFESKAKCKEEGAEYTASGLHLSQPGFMRSKCLPPSSRRSHISPRVQQVVSRSLAHPATIACVPPAGQGNTYCGTEIGRWVVDMHSKRVALNARLAICLSRPTCNVHKSHRFDLASFKADAKNSQSPRTSMNAARHPSAKGCPPPSMSSPVHDLLGVSPESNTFMAYAK